MREEREKWSDRLAEPRTFRAIATGLIVVIVCGLVFVGVMAAQLVSSGDEPETAPIRSAGQYVGRGLEVIEETPSTTAVPATTTTVVAGGNDSTVSGIESGLPSDDPDAAPDTEIDPPSTTASTSTTEPMPSTTTAPCPELYVACVGPPESRVPPSTAPPSPTTTVG